MKFMQLLVPIICHVCNMTTVSTIGASNITMDQADQPSHLKVTEVRTIITTYIAWNQVLLGCVVLIFTKAAELMR